MPDRTPVTARGMPPAPAGINAQSWARLLHQVEDHLRRSPTGKITGPGEPVSWPIGGNSDLDYISGTHYAQPGGGWRVRRDTARAAVYTWRDADPEGAAARDEHAATHRYAGQWEASAANERRRISDPTHPAHDPNLPRGDLEMYERYRDLALEEAHAARQRGVSCETQLTLGF